MTIPNSVTSIGGFAFYYCSSLTNVQIPDSVTTIGDSAFAYNTSLANITLPINLKTINNSVFQSYLSAVRVVSIKPGESLTSNQNGSDTCEYEITINAITKPDSTIGNGVNIRFVTIRKSNAGYCIVGDGTGP